MTAVMLHSQEEEGCTGAAVVDPSFSVPVARSISVSDGGAAQRSASEAGASAAVAATVSAAFAAVVLHIQEEGAAAGTAVAVTSWPLPAGSLDSCSSSSSVGSAGEEEPQQAGEEEGEARDEPEPSALEGSPAPPNLLNQTLRRRSGPAPSTAAEPFALGLLLPSPGGFDAQAATASSATALQPRPMDPDAEATRAAAEALLLPPPTFLPLHDIREEGDEEDGTHSSGEPTGGPGSASSGPGGDGSSSGSSGVGGGAGSVTSDGGHSTATSSDDVRAPHAPCATAARPSLDLWDGMMEFRTPSAMSLNSAGRWGSEGGGEGGKG